MESEVPKHRKKKNKSVKKSNHKHDYKDVAVKYNWQIRNIKKEEEYCTFTVLQKCSICGKENKEMHWKEPIENFNKLVEEIGLNKNEN